MIPFLEFLEYLDYLFWLFKDHMEWKVREGGRFTKLNTAVKFTIALFYGLSMFFFFCFSLSLSFQIKILFCFLVICFVTQFVLQGMYLNCFP